MTLTSLASSLAGAYLFSTPRGDYNDFVACVPLTKGRIGYPICRADSIMEPIDWAWAIYCSDNFFGHAYMGMAVLLSLTHRISQIYLRPVRLLPWLRSASYTRVCVSHTGTIS